MSGTGPGRNRGCWQRCGAREAPHRPCAPQLLDHADADACGHSRCKPPSNDIARTPRGSPIRRRVGGVEDGTTRPAGRQLTQRPFEPARSRHNLATARRRSRNGVGSAPDPIFAEHRRGRGRAGMREWHSNLALLPTSTISIVPTAVYAFMKVRPRSTGSVRMRVGPGRSKEGFLCGCI